MMPLAGLGGLFLAFLLCVAIFPTAIGFAHRLGFVVPPDFRRRHPRATPHVGGIVTLISAFTVIAGFCAVFPDWFSQVKADLIPIFAATALLSILGWVDDRKGLNAFHKFPIQILAALVAICLSPSVREFCLIWKAHLGYAIFPLVLIWIVGLTNAFNLIDGIDGLAGGASFCTLLGIVCSQYLSGGFSPSVLICLTLIGALAGFLKFNWNPAKVFLGDNGSLPLGFLVACLSLSNISANSPWQSTIAIVIAVSYPIIDMGICTYKRYLSGDPLFKADRRHLHYRLSAIGFSIPLTAAGLVGICAILQLGALSFKLGTPESATLTFIALGSFTFMLLQMLGKFEKTVSISSVRSLELKASASQLVNYEPMVKHVRALAGKKLGVDEGRYASGQ